MVAQVVDKVSFCRWKSVAGIGEARGYAPCSARRGSGLRATHPSTPTTVLRHPVPVTGLLCDYTTPRSILFWLSAVLLQHQPLSVTCSVLRKTQGQRTKYPASELAHLGPEGIHGAAPAWLPAAPTTPHSILISAPRSAFSRHSPGSKIREAGPHPLPRPSNPATNSNKRLPPPVFLRYSSTAAAPRTHQSPHPAYVRPGCIPGPCRDTRAPRQPREGHTCR